MSPNDEFDTLSVTLKSRIDSAFDSVIKNDRADDTEEKDQNAHAGGLVVDNEPGGFVLDEPGGFVVEESEYAAEGFFVEDSEQAAGGFIFEKETLSPTSFKRRKRTKKHTHIPLSLIPQALSILDLPDDDEVLNVFRNAATGWVSAPNAGSSTGRGRGENAEEVVSRDDWRAVCAALLAGLGENGPDGDLEYGGANRDEAEGDDNESEGDSDLTEYTEDEDADDDNYSDDEFSPMKSSKAKARQGRQRGRNLTGLSSHPSSPGIPSLAKRKREASPDLTSRQKQTVLATFSLFFDGDSDPTKRRIGVTDIRRVAKDLKEKIGTEEIAEMLQEFTSAPDKSMGLEEFRNMMIEAGLV